MTKHLEKVYKLLGWAYEISEDPSTPIVKLYLKKFSTDSENKIVHINTNYKLLEHQIYNPPVTLLLSKFTIDNEDDLVNMVKNQPEDLWKITFETAPRNLITELNRYIINIRPLTEFNSNSRDIQAKAAWKRNIEYM